MFSKGLVSLACESFTDSIDCGSNQSNNNDLDSHILEGRKVTNQLEDAFQAISLAQEDVNQLQKFRKLLEKTSDKQFRNIKLPFSVATESICVRQNIEINKITKTLTIESISENIKNIRKTIINWFERLIKYLVNFFKNSETFFKILYKKFELIKNKEISYDTKIVGNKIKSNGIAKNLGFSTKEEFFKTAEKFNSEYERCSTFLNIIFNNSQLTARDLERKYRDKKIDDFKTNFNLSPQFIIEDKDNEICFSLADTNKLNIKIFLPKDNLHGMELIEELSNIRSSFLITNYDDVEEIKILDENERVIILKLLKSSLTLQRNTLTQKNEMLLNLDSLLQMLRITNSNNNEEDYFNKVENCIIKLIGETTNIFTKYEIFQSERSQNLSQWIMRNDDKINELDHDNEHGIGG